MGGGIFYKNTYHNDNQLHYVYLKQIPSLMLRWACRLIRNPTTATDRDDNADKDDGCQFAQNIQLHPNRSNTSTPPPFKHVQVSHAFQFQIQARLLVIRLHFMQATYVFCGSTALFFLDCTLSSLLPSQLITFFGPVH